MDPIKAAIYMTKYKLSTVCITCNKFWRAREQNVPEPQCLSKTGCGSPIAGDYFHEYEGPITDFTRWCFVCGQDATNFVRVAVSTRLFGMCDSHIGLLQSLSPVNVSPEQKAMDKIVIKDGEEVLSGKEDIYKKKTVFEAINEVEDYYAKKEGR